MISNRYVEAPDVEPGRGIMQKIMARDVRSGELVMIKRGWSTRDEYRMARAAAACGVSTVVGRWTTSTRWATSPEPVYVIPMLKGAVEVDRYMDEHDLSKRQQIDALMGVLFQYITGSSDGHSGNWLADRKHVYAIDMAYPGDEVIGLLNGEWTADGVGFLYNAVSTDEAVKIAQHFQFCAPVFRSLSERVGIRRNWEVCLQGLVESTIEYVREQR